jgi:hypothetical protein
VKFEIQRSRRHATEKKSVIRRRHATLFAFTPPPPLAAATTAFHYREGHAIATRQQTYRHAFSFDATRIRFFIAVYAATFVTPFPPPSMEHGTPICCRLIPTPTSTPTLTVRWPTLFVLYLFSFLTFSLFLSFLLFSFLFLFSFFLFSSFFLN